MYLSRVLPGVRQEGVLWIRDGSVYSAGLGSFPIPEGIASSRRASDEARLSSQ